MVIKSNGNTCGAKVDDCTKKNHQQLQKAVPSRRGRDGVYDGIFIREAAEGQARRIVELAHEFGC